jgi:hypothetical protein
MMYLQLEEMAFCHLFFILTHIYILIFKIT